MIEAAKEAENLTTKVCMRISGGYMERKINGLPEEIWK
jgi:hypothetical protein